MAFWSLKPALRASLGLSDARPLRPARAAAGGREQRGAGARRGARVRALLGGASVVFEL